MLSAKPVLKILSIILRTAAFPIVSPFPFFIFPVYKAFAKDFIVPAIWSACWISNSVINTFWFSFSKSDKALDKKRPN